jgi:uncharacterized protein (TIGR02172 family)
MHGDLGNPIAYGRTSEIYRWGEKHVLKLFYDWVDLESIENEAQVTRRIYESGLPVPEVGELVHVNERTGLIYQRLEGASMYKEIQRKPWNIARYFKRAVELQVEIHSHSIAGHLPSQRQILERSIHQAEALPGHLRSKVLAALAPLPDGNQLCHGDFWAGNIQMTRHGEVVIDWHNASRGNPLADLARTIIGTLGGIRTRQIRRLNLSYGTSKTGQIKNSLLQLMVRVSSPIYLNHYFKLRPGGEDECRRWLPIVAAARLSRNIPELEKMLIEQVERTL